MVYGSLRMRVNSVIIIFLDRDFDMKHLAMMKTVYPNGFIFRQEKGLHTAEGSKSVDHQLTVEANFKDVMLVSAKKIPSNVLISRRLKFENALLDITKEHHQVRELTHLFPTHPFSSP